MNPLVSCIMPTRNRPDFILLAVSYFQRQDYRNAELIILDDSDKGNRYTSEDARIMSIKINPPNSIGAKRNLCCDFAKGDLICHWDDDDWYARDRISQQVAVMQANPQAQATAYHSMIFAREADRKAWRYTGDSMNIPGVSLMYRRDWWREHEFDESERFGEDNKFVTVLRDKLTISDHDAIVARIHPGNTCQKHEDGNLKNERWRRVEWAEVLALGYEESMVCA